MNTNSNSNNDLAANPISLSLISLLAGGAAATFKGISWESAARDKLAWLMAQGGRPHETQYGSWANDPNHYQRVVAATTAAELLALVEEEAEDVAEAAADAAAAGEEALRFLSRGDIEAAAESAKEAVTIERAYGDAPSWGPFMRAVEQYCAEQGEEE